MTLRMTSDGAQSLFVVLLTPDVALLSKYFAYVKVNVVFLFISFNR